MTFTLELPVRKLMDARAKAPGMNLTHYMQMPLETHLIETGAADEPLACRLAARRQVIARVVELASKLDAEGRLDENFFLTIVGEAGKMRISKRNMILLWASMPAQAREGQMRAGGAERADRPRDPEIGWCKKQTKRTGENAHGQAVTSFVTTYASLGKAA